MLSSNVIRVRDVLSDFNFYFSLGCCDQVLTVNHSENYEKNEKKMRRSSTFREYFVWKVGEGIRRREKYNWITNYIK